MDETLKQELTLGRTLFERGQYVDAERCLSAVLQKSTSFADVHWMLGVIYYDQGHLAPAQQCFESALKINPAFTEAALNLAVVYNDLGKYGEARQVYERALVRQKATPGKLEGYVKGKVANL